jgi:hypothetical protein
MTRLILDHSIVGQSLTSLSVRKDREFAGCAICGAVFQSRLAIELSDEEWNADRKVFEIAVAIETREWRDRHNKTHSEKVHRAFRASGRTFSPEAAHKLAPFGLVSLDDCNEDEVAHAMLEAPRAPVDDVETTRKGWI